ncbi:autotransporter-associated N-terminal domain-containing protein [Leptotrichia wadei]|uniref:autotransporter-associated N-terminal domain-containing protein n=1 Tax=Leptotrichia wadei TaxID=157687 RepID=UPI0028DBAB37|nr:autotransporter-associated N-terminal domain-containing protein [Leptotrichia wadei]
MTNNLRKVKKDLCAFAKKYKDFKYTDSALITFLITGAVNISNNLFSAETNKNIRDQKQTISTSIKDIHHQAQEIRRENDKLLKKENLELIQLMEQGDHVVKSPWSSWQYGINGFYNNWGGTYKGRGDKSEKYPYEGKFERSENRFERSTSPLSSNYSLLSKSRNPKSATTSGRFGYEKGYGISSTEKRQEPVGTLNIDASIKPKEIHKYAVAAPNINVNAPVLAPLSIPTVVPPTLTIPTPNPPVVKVDLPQPSAKPFVDFSFQNGTLGLITPTSYDEDVRYTPSSSRITNGEGHTFWTGYNNTDKLVNASGVDNDALPNGYTKENIGRRVTNRTGALLYFNSGYRLGAKPAPENKFQAQNFDLYLAGNIGNAGTTDGNHEGALGIHTVWNGKLSNVKAHLYGKAAFLSLETWWAGKMEFDNTPGKEVKVNIQKVPDVSGTGEENTIFLIYPGTYDRIKRENPNLGATKQRGGFIGKVDADIKTDKNIVYSVLGAQGSFEIDSKGKYNITGNNNIVYSGYGYVPNWNNLIGTGTKFVVDNLQKGMTPSIKLSEPPIINGNKNIVLLFNDKMDKTSVAGINVYGGNNNNWKKSVIGIYQGEIDARARIGTDNASKEVESNIGIYSRSGQRGKETINGQVAQILPKEDLGAEDNDIIYNSDEIHSLQINNVDITFGKNSKNGVMVASERGTVIDVAMPGNLHSTVVKDNSGNAMPGKTDSTTVPIMTTPIKDYEGTSPLTASYDDTANEVATGTVIAYASGEWKNADHRMTTSDAQKFEGKGSQINIGQDVVMSARYKDYTPVGATTKVESFPVAYVAKNKGEITAEKTTDAKGFGSIIAYADNSAKITLNGKVTAVDEWAAIDDDTKPYLYKNIGGYAKTGTAGSTITFKDDVKIHGMGGFAQGSGSLVKFEGTKNEIYSAKEGGLIAWDGGKIDFKGGKIDTKKRNATDDYSGVVPFLADAGSNINFSGHTDVTISDGILMPGTAADYDGNDVSIAPAGKKYTGMSNMDVTVDGTGVILRVTEGGTTADNKWTGPGGLLTGIKNDMHLNKLTVNPGADYKVFYKDGQYSIEQSIDLDNATEFDRIKFLNEKIFIAPSTSITSTSGKGMIVGSYDSSNAPSNASTGYVNNGTVDISGGKASTTALSTSYGSIENNSSIKLDKGVAVYGINGSKLVNETKGTIELSDKGVGMAAFTSGNNLQSYGTDKKIAAGTLGNTEKTLEIENKGLIKSNANGSVGIYGELNTVTGAHSSIEVGKAGTSHGSIRNAGKIVLTGDNSVGIVSKVTPPAGATDPLQFGGPEVKLNGTGSSDIVTTGNDGIGVYADNTKVTFETDYGVEVKDRGTGIFVEGNNPSLNDSKNFELKYSGAPTASAVAFFMNNKSTLPTSSMTNKMNITLNDTVNNTEGLVGILAKGTAGDINNQGNITGNAGYGIISEGVEVRNSGNITLPNPLDAASKKASVGIYVKNGNKITNSGDITIGKYSVGIYGHQVENSGNINVGDAGTGIFSTAGNVDLTGGTINVGTDQAAGIYVNGDNQTVTAHSGANMTIADNSFGIISEKGTGSAGNKIVSNIGNINNLGDETVYIYSNDNRAGAQVTNNTNLTSTGSYNYGVYSAGEVVNNGNINFGSGYGNVGVYSTLGGTATNNASITVGESYFDPISSLNNRYAIGMAAGYTPTAAEIAAGKVGYTGNIVNNGVINVTGKGSIGMYGTGAGTTVYNGTASNRNAVINLNSSETTGIYLDNGAYGYNYGTIKSNGSGLKKVVGVVVKNGSTIENHGNIDITAEDARGILSKGNASGANLGIVKNYGTFNINGVTDSTDATVIGVDTASDLTKTVSGVKIDVPRGSSVGTITVNGNPVIPELATTSAEEFQPMELSKIGMYIDTSNKVYTNPITGLSSLTGLRKADLIVGAEAAQNTTAKYIQVDSKITDPYNATIRANPQIEKWNIYSGSLTWMATVAQNSNDGTIENAYLAKIPYTYWAGNEASPVNPTDTYNFLDGLEQRYGVEALGSRENQLFQKLNGIGNNEEILFYQAMDEMMGHQYANTQMRINATGNMLDKEFRYLKHDWRNPSKQNNKIKVFGMRDQYKTDTAGIIDYTSNAYGVAYVHEDEKIKMGNSDGWYAGVVTNRFKFSDIGHSKEDQTMLKAGVFKTMSPKKDYNGALQWTIGGDVFAGINNMKRKFLVVDDVFEAKSNYNSYGAALKTDLGYDIRMSERTHLRPYGMLKMEYGRFNSIKEDSGQMRLEVKGNDYFSVKPEAGVEFKYVQPLAVRTNLTVGLTAAYENELGKVGDVNNEARVRYTNADWFGIRGEKEDRRGNGKFDLNIGVDNTRFGVTVNAGYDTKGSNVRGGIGFRAIY